MAVKSGVRERKRMVDGAALKRLKGRVSDWFTLYQSVPLVGQRRSQRTRDCRGMSHLGESVSERLAMRIVLNNIWLRSGYRLVKPWILSG
jgi:hypothetical protein